MKNIFAKKPYTKCVGEIIPRPFSKISKLIISLDQSSKVLYSLFLSYAKMRLSKYIETKLQTTHIKLFKNAKIGVELGSLLHFFHFFWRKIFILLYSINWLNFIVWLYLLREILSSVYIPIVCLQGCDVMNFEINLTFLIEPFFQHIQLMFHPCSWNLRKPRRMEMCMVMITNSTSLKYRLLESHVVVPLSTLSVAVKPLIYLLANFYFVISLQDHTSHWLEDGMLIWRWKFKRNLLMRKLSFDSPF